MADEEKKAETAATPKEEPSPTVSHSEPTGAAQLQDAAPAHDDQAHGHDDHGHAAPAADFGEVIPEKNWQDGFLACIAALVLCGFLAIGMIWSKIEPPKEAEGAGHEAGHEATHEPQVPPTTLPAVPSGDSK